VTRSFFFYGVHEGDEGDPVWETLHQHFEKLAREDDAGEGTVTNRRAAKRKEGLGG
jgi:hypothetical protein